MNNFAMTTLRLCAWMSVLSLSGCALTIPATVQMHGSTPEVNNMIVVEDLGVGYDYIHLDPEDMASSSVQQRGVRPRVFAFEADPDPFHTIDIPLLGNQAPGRRNSVLGVDAETNPRFDWSDNTRFVYNARDFQNAYSTAFTAGGAAPVGAAFSASASYGQVKETTSSESGMYAYKDGTFRGHVLELNPYYQHTLTPGFRRAISELGTTPGDLGSYREFILNWGTHYSRQVTIGAKCSFRETISKEYASANFQDSQAFEANVSARMGLYEASFGGGTDRSGGQGSQQSSEFQELTFISYGGSGAGVSSFEAWTNAAVVNTTLIDLKLASYLELLNPTYFPDDSLIQRKHDLMLEALIAYDSDQIARIDTSASDPAAFLKDDLVLFLAEVATIYCHKSKEWAQHEWRSQYWGKLNLELVNSNYLPLQPPVPIFNRPENRDQPGTAPSRNYIGPLRLQEGEAFPLGALFVFKVSSSQLNGAAISVTGQLKELQNFHNQLFPRLLMRNPASTVELKSVTSSNPGEQKIVLVSDSGDDEVFMTLKVTRIGG